MLNFFIILAIKQHTETIEFHIFQTFEIENLGKCHGGEKRHFRCSISNLWPCIADFFHNFSFAATYEDKRISQILNICNRKSRSSSKSTIFAMTSFDDNCQSLQTSFFTFFIFAKVRPVRPKVTDTHTHKRTSL